MTTPFWVLLVTALIPYVLAGIGAAQRKSQLGTIDNSNWRANQLPQLTGLGSRAYSAQANTWEAVAMFTAAVTVNHLAGADPGPSAVAALVFLGARVAHTLLYLADQATLRTLAFLIGWGSCLWLFALAIQA
ncbi:MAG: MAPEG family protein [Acidobacteriota bacterium]